LNRQKLFAYRLLIGRINFCNYGNFFYLWYGGNLFGNESVTRPDGLIGWKTHYNYVNFRPSIRN